MKTLRFCLFLLSSYCFVIQLDAQIANGSTPPDWTATDLDGNVWDLSDMVNDGKHVIIDFAAAWCGLCWSYHQTDVIENLDNLYGPNGSDQVRVFFIEADLSTNTECLYGQANCNVSTFGNWVEGHDYPFISIGPGNANSMYEDYAVNYYPMTYAINAYNNTIYETGAPTGVNTWNSWLFESFEMSLTSTIVDAICPGEGAIEINSINGAGDISYVWSDGLGNANFIEQLELGSYTVTATDENGYEIIETFFVDGPTTGPVEVELLSSIDVDCNGGDSGVLTVGGSGGNSGYTYTWNNGDSGSSIDGLAAGDYLVTVNDSEGCFVIETFTVYEPDILILSIQTDDSNCGNADGQVVALTTGGISPRQYDFGNGENTSGIFDGIEPGDYVMTVTDFNGCIESSPFTINATEAPVASAEAVEDIDCSNIDVMISGQGSSEGDEIGYDWTTEDGSIVEGANEIDVTVDAAGTYTLAVTDSATGCTESIDVTINADIEAPMTSIQDPETLNCNTEMTILDASGSSEGEIFIYQWSTEDGNIINGADENAALIDAPGTYNFLITNTDNGCSSEQSVTVTLDDELPTVSVEDQIIDCTNTEVELCADVEAGSMVTWATQEGEVEATCISVGMAGTYFAEVIGNNGCIATDEAIVSLSADLPQVSIAEPETLTCIVTSITLEASLEGNLSDYSILWTSPADIEINNEDLSINVDEAGQYTLAISNLMNGCTTTTSIIVDQVIINPESVFTSSLNDGTLILNSSSTGDPSSFSWNFGSTDENTVTTFDETGTYEVCLTVFNDCGEDTHCDDVYFVSQLLFENSTTNVLCFGEDQGSITVEPSGGEPGYTISWVGPNGFTSTLLSIANLIAGDYSMVLHDTYGYEKTGSYIIIEPDAIIGSSVLITHETNNTQNGSITLGVEGGTGALSYDWSNGSNTADLSGLTAGDYSVVVTDENGCSKEFGPYTIQSSIVSVQDLRFINSLQVYPVPAFENVNISVELTEAMNTQMRVLDAYGKVITNQNFNRKKIHVQLDLSNFISGVYYIEFSTKGTKSLEKFVVIRQ
ncbi:MAG: PKD repeat protein [Saprospiraceae bacterium]|jgi:PKD repeat protein